MATPTLPEHVRPQDAVLLYDGLCGFCDSTVRWFLRRKVEQDGSGQIFFAAQQSELAQDIVKRHGLDILPANSVYLLIHPGTGRECILKRSDAILHALAMLGGVWNALAALAVALPRTLRDAIYAAIARNRYRIAGKRTECSVPTPDEHSRFLGL